MDNIHNMLLTMSEIDLLVYPFQSPETTLLVKVSILDNAFFTSGKTFTPSTQISFLDWPATFPWLPAEWIAVYRVRSRLYRE